MKSLCYQLALILIILNFPSKIFPQSNIGISNDNSMPDPSAMLDVKSTTKGILIPRMTNAERNAIANPASGLMIYNNSENCFNFFNGTTWIKIVAGQDEDWTISGSDMFNNNPGNIGIGTSTPDTKLTIHGDETNVKLDMNQASPNPTQGLILAVDHVEKGSFHIEKLTNNLVIEADKNDSGFGDILLKKHGDDRLAIRSNGDIQFKRHGDERLSIIGPVGNVGIGTALPDSRLTITGDATDVKLDMNQASENLTQGLIFAIDHTARGSFHIEKLTNNLVIEADKNDSGFGDILLKKHGDDRLAIRSNGDIQFKRHGDERLSIIGPVGNVGIGTALPDSRLTITGDATDVKLDMNQASENLTQGLIFAIDHTARGSFHIEKLTNNLVIEADKNDSGFGDILLKKHGDDRLAIRNNGDVHFKKEGSDKLVIKGDNGNVGIGTSNPASKLDVNGSVKVGYDPNPPSPLNAGSIRYRVEANGSFCEMVMQVGPVNYAWVVIQQFTW